MEIVKNRGAGQSEIVLPEVVKGPTCSSCPCWNPVAAMKSQNPADADGGQCRLKPPVNFLMPVRTLKGDELGVNAFWPATAANQWCEQHPERALKTRQMLERLQAPA